MDATAAAADALYDSADNRSLIHTKKMRAYIPSRRERKHKESVQLSLDLR